MQGKKEPGTSAIIHFVNELPQLELKEKGENRERWKREGKI